MYHYFYISARNPRLSTAGFIDRWRRHAVLAAQIPKFWSPVRRYVQNDVLPDGFLGAPLVSKGYDALGEFFFDTSESKAAPPEHLSNDLSEITDPKRERLLFGGEQEVLRGSPEGPYRVIRLTTASSPELRPALAEKSRSSSLTLPSQSVAVSKSTQPTFGIDVVVTSWVENLDDATALVNSDQWAELRQATSNLTDIEKEITLVAREVVLQPGPWEAE